MDFTEIISTAQAAVDPSTIQIGSEVYLSKQVYLPPSEPSLKTLAINTLQGLIDYLKSCPEQSICLDFIHIKNPTTVLLYESAQGRARQRNVVIEALADRHTCSFNFGTYLPAEKMLIALQSQFIATEDRAALLAVLGNLKDESVKNFSDDGVTQSVTTRTGIARVENTAVPNPVELRPFRTFPCVDQPMSPFIFRMTAGKSGESPQCALFEAGGEAWQLEAIASIKEWLEINLKAADIDIPIIA